MLCLAVFAVQACYGLVLGMRDPFNSFIAGVFCSLGMFGLTMGLRIQLSTSDFKDVACKQLVFEYVIGCSGMTWIRPGRSSTI